MLKVIEKKDNEERLESTKTHKIVNLIVLIVQIVLLVICVTISVFIIANPVRYAETPKDCNTDLMLVMTDSMEPTLMTNDLILGKNTPDGVLSLGTVVTFAVKTYDGYYLDTHRIVGYYYSYVLGEETKYGRVYRIAGELENEADFKETYSNCTILGYVTRGDKYTLEFGATIENPTIISKDENGEEFVNYSKDDAGYRKFDEVLAVWSGKKVSGVGTILRFLQDPVAFALIILLPLSLLFIYNVFLIVRMIIDSKTTKAREAALSEIAAVKIDEEEIKRKAIEEYLASLKKKLEEENNSFSEE